MIQTSVSEWHQRKLGPEASLGHLQPGLIALTAGIIVGLAGVGLYLIGEQTGARLAWRKSAIAMAALAAPLIFGGIVLALPARLPLRIVAALGVALNLTAIGLFWGHYPQQFNAGLGQDRAPLDAALYASGSALNAGALLAQVVGFYVRRRADVDGEVAWDAEYEVPAWLIEKDIDEAMAKHPVSWGAGQRPASLVEVHVPSFGADAIVRGHGVARHVDLEMPELENKSRRLRGLTASSVEVSAQPIGDATTALSALRRLQAEHPRRYRPPRRSWWRRLLHI